MTEPDPPEARLWERGWDAHTREQRRRLATLTLAEKLAWLEQAQVLAARLARRPEVLRSDEDEAT